MWTTAVASSTSYSGSIEGSLDHDKIVAISGTYLLSTRYQGTTLRSLLEKMVFRPCRGFRF
jgi:hypothetical protein